MKIFAAVVGIIALAVIAVVITAMLRPRTFSISRTIEIAAPAGTVFPLIDSMRAFNRWNPFLKPDPNAQVAYSGPEHGIGAAQDWSGNSQIGSGRVEITDSVADRAVAMRLIMRAPIAAENAVQFALDSHAGTTRVTWTMSGESSLLPRIIHLFISMDRMVGDRFVEGLRALRALAESQPAKANEGGRS